MLPDIVKKLFGIQTGDNRQLTQRVESRNRVCANLHAKMHEALEANSRANKENERVKSLLEGVLREARDGVQVQ